MAQKRKLYTRFFLYAILGFSLFKLGQFAKRETGGFTLTKIHFQTPPLPEWETPPPSSDVLNHALNQTYRYLAKGAQSYVFASNDGKYVIKFIGQHHLRPTFLQQVIPSKVLQKQEKFQKTYTSLKIGQDQLFEETGLIYLHLNKTDFLHKNLKIIDKIGIEHDLDLDNLGFILQKRAALLYPTFATWIENGHVDKAKNAIHKMVAMLFLRIEKKIDDKDPDLNTNFGIYEGMPIQIDFGRFEKREYVKSQKDAHDEVIRITDNFKQWLDTKSPDLSAYLLEEINRC